MKLVSRRKTGSITRTTANRASRTMPPSGAARISRRESVCTLPSLCQPVANSSDGVEVVSPVLTAVSNWQEQLTTLFSTIEKGFKLISHDSAATHVHVAPDRGWNDDEVKQIGKGVIVWTPPMLCRRSPRCRAMATFALVRSFDSLPSTAPM